MKKFGVNRLSVRTRLLACLLGGVFIVAIIFFVTPLAIAQAQSGFVTITAKVEKPLPSTSASIDTPRNGDTLSTGNTTVAGKCTEEGLIVNIIDNGNFVGSTVCGGDGRFSIKINLYLGINRLVARQLNSDNKYGPDSVMVSVTYAVLNSTPEGQIVKNGISQLSIDLDPSYVGNTNCQAGQLLSFPLKITGGAGPYAIHIKWGDESDSLYSRNNTDSFVLAHKYKKSGVYQASIQVSDNVGQQATLNVVIIIDGDSPRGQNVANTTKNRLSNNDQSLLIYAASFVFLPTGYILGRRRRVRDSVDNVRQ